MAGRLPRGAAAVLQSATQAGLYLGALERANFDVFDQALVASGGVSPLRYALTLKTNMVMGRF
jgi:hypothetical protein